MGQTWYSKKMAEHLIWGAIFSLPILALPSWGVPDNTLHPGHPFMTQDPPSNSSTWRPDHQRVPDPGLFVALKIPILHLHVKMKGSYREMAKTGNHIEFSTTEIVTKPIRGSLSWTYSSFSNSAWPSLAKMSMLESHVQIRTVLFVVWTPGRSGNLWWFGVPPLGDSCHVRLAFWYNPRTCLLLEGDEFIYT